MMLNKLEWAVYIHSKTCPGKKSIVGAFVLEADALHFKHIKEETEGMAIDWSVSRIGGNNERVK